jgi:type IV pilus assembly protein PilA
MRLLLPVNNKGGDSEGFTLVELLVVIGILTILLSIALIAINPLRQFKQADNTRRRSDILAILNAITEYAADNSGSLPGTLSSVSSSAETLASDTSSGNIDFCSYIVPTYIAAMPYDPDSGNWTSCSSYDTGYTVIVSASDNRVTVNAPSAELSETININR